jgi:hypothetical protein
VADVHESEREEIRTGSAGCTPSSQPFDDMRLRTGVLDIHCLFNFLDPDLTMETLLGIALVGVFGCGIYIFIRYNHSIDDRRAGRLYVTPIEFAEFREKMRNGNCEGLVMLGTLPPLGEWVESITDLLYKAGAIIVDRPERWLQAAYQLKTTGGRIDLAMVFCENGTNIVKEKLLEEQLDFEGSTWVSDYLRDYKIQFGIKDEESDLDPIIHKLMEEVFEKRRKKDAGAAENTNRSRITEGMTTDQVRSAWGEPANTQVKMLKSRQREVWLYDQYGKNRYHSKVFFENNIVVGWERV